MPQEIRPHIRGMITAFRERAERVQELSRDAEGLDNPNGVVGTMTLASELAATLPILHQAIVLCLRMDEARGPDSNV